MLVAAIAGFLFGFWGSIPVAGPVAALVLDRGLAGHYRAGFAVAIGSSIAEAVYAYLVFWGVATLLERYTWLEMAASAIATTILFVLAIVFIRSKDEQKEQEREARPSRSIWRDAMLGFVIVALNPALLATWAGALTMVSGFGFDIEAGAAWLFALMAAMGISIWYFIWLLFIRRHRGKLLKGKRMQKMRRGIGVLLLLVASYFLLSTLSLVG